MQVAKYYIIYLEKRKKDKKEKEGTPMKKVKIKPRDKWIPESWGYNGAGPHKNKKKTLPRKQKYKNKVDYN